LLKQTDVMRKHAKDEGVRLDLIIPTKSTSPKFGTDLLRYTVSRSTFYLQDNPDNFVQDLEAGAYRIY
jgi:hypothetical protein